MSFQAYLDTIETKTGKTPREMLALAAQKGFEGPSVKAGQVIEWLKNDFDLGRGHAMALVHVIKHGPTISTDFVGTTGTHRDDSDTLWLDGMATRPQ